MLVTAFFSDGDVQLLMLLQMYGRYTKDLGDYAKEEAKKLAKIERIRKKEDRCVGVF